MKHLTTTFTCDEPDCPEVATIFADKEQSIRAHLKLVERGWTVQTPFAGRWKHYCPTHKPERT